MAHGRPESLKQELLDILQQGTHSRQVKKGANEGKSDSLPPPKLLIAGVSELVIMAGDASPLAIVMHLPLLCEDKSVPCVVVPSKIALGRACGVSRSIIAASINTNDASDLDSQIRQLKLKVERLMI
ncbi:ribonucleoprotein-associated protein [Penicillium herquei]|nr:ribonucleoprotein-associated protein [Penicillium herquei]